MRPTPKGLAKPPRKLNAKERQAAEALRSVMSYLREFCREDGPQDMVEDQTPMTSAAQAEYSKCARALNSLGG